MLPHCCFCSLLLVAAFCGVNDAILAGEPVDWVRNGFLAKVLARNGTNGPVKSCTGALISASLVLTSGHCVMDRDTGHRMTEMVVILPKAGRKTDPLAEHRSTAKIVTTSGGEQDNSGGWALLRIVPRNISEICPPAPAPSWISRLNFRPSLIGPSHLTVDPAELTNNMGGACQIIGFSTTDLANDFLTEDVVFRLFLEQVSPPPIDDPLQHYRSRVYNNFTACYDDAGAPLLCKLPSLGETEFQLGIFQSLTVPVMDKQQQEEDQMDADDMKHCRKAREMRFTLFAEDQKLARAIQQHAMADFVEVYQKCGFSATEGM